MEVLNLFSLTRVKLCESLECQDQTVFPCCLIRAFIVCMKNEQMVYMILPEKTNMQADLALFTSCTICLRQFAQNIKPCFTDWENKFITHLSFEFGLKKLLLL